MEEQPWMWLAYYRMHLFARSIHEGLCEGAGWLQR